MSGLDPLLRAEDLCVRFETEAGRIEAVRGVSFELHRGRILGVVGESGSGKTTLATAIIGLLADSGRVVSGSVMYGGRDLTALSEREMRGVRGAEIAMVFQDPLAALDPVFTVGSQVAEAIRAHERVSRAEARERAAGLLRRVGIAHAESRLDDFPHQLSGGMRQRVLLAISLAGDPAVLIADEPTAALDVTIQAQVLGLLEELSREQRMGIVLVTHDLGVVAEVADDVMVMYAGRRVEAAPVAELLAAPRHPYTIGLLASLPSATRPRTGPLPAIDGVPPSLAYSPDACDFAPRCAFAQPACRERRPALRELSPGRLVACHLAEDASLEAIRRRAIPGAGSNDAVGEAG